MLRREKVWAFRGYDRHAATVSLDNIPRAWLMRSAARGIGDSRMLGPLEMWLEAPADEIDAPVAFTLFLPNEARKARRSFPARPPA
jgi:hypothetical protein